MLPFSLSGELSLELLETRHAEPVFRVVDENRADLRTWLPWVDQTKDPSVTKVFIQKALYQLAQGRGFHCAILAGSELAGVIGFHETNLECRSTSLGYWLAPAHRGKGIMTASCRALVDHAFAKMAIHRLEIRCAPKNTKSRAIPERLAFTIDGTARGAEWLNGKPLDNVIYSKLAPEWSKAP